MKVQWYRTKWVTIALHAAFWILFFVLPYLLQPAVQNEHAQHPREEVKNSFTYFNLVKCLFWMLVFYFNAYFLFPRLIYRKRYVVYTLSLLGLLILLSVLEISFFRLMGNAGRFKIPAFLMFNLFPFLFIIASGTAYRMYLDKTEEDKKLKEKEAENLKSELSFLRSQISPHFMFNILNNIVALARKKSDLVEPSLIKLSSLMRYFLYESNADKVPLEKEAEYLESYIALQQQRFGKNVAINFNTAGIHNGVEIEPMLLIPFVENAFKHGILQNSSIDINMNIDKDVLHFSVVNPFTEKALDIKDETSGIGLANVRRRLNLLYPRDHSLLISQQDGKFKVSLELNLH